MKSLEVRSLPDRVYAVEKLLKDAGDKLTDADKAPVNAAIQKVRDALSRQDVAALKTATSELDAAASAMQQHVASKGGPTGAPPEPGPEPKGGGDDVMDAEYEVKK